MWAQVWSCQQENGQPSQGQNTEKGSPSPAARTASSWGPMSLSLLHYFIPFPCHIVLLTSRTGLGSIVKSGHWLGLIQGVMSSLTLWVWFCKNPLLVWKVHKALELASAFPTAVEMLIASLPFIPLVWCAALSPGHFPLGINPPWQGSLSPVSAPEQLGFPQLLQVHSQEALGCGVGLGRGWYRPLTSWKVFTSILRGDRGIDPSFFGT